MLRTAERPVRKLYRKAAADVPPRRCPVKDSEAGRRLHFEHAWPITLLAVIFLPILLTLGSWQWRKGLEQDVFEARLEQRQSRAPVALSSLDPDADDLDQLPVRAEGRLLVEQPVWRDNRTYRGRAGYELLVPMVADGIQADAVLINLGWFAAGATRAELPAVQLPRHAVEFEGVLDHERDRPTVFGDVVEVVDGGLRVQRAELDELASALDLQLFPRILIARADQPGVGNYIYEPVRVTAARHRGYALQWFGLALVLVLGWLAACFSWRPREGQQDT